jgi:5'-3' exonuclease
MQFLPSCYQFLMSSSDSPILDFYPKDFKVRRVLLKRRPWWV